MGGRDKNFKDLMQSDQDVRNTRYGRRSLSLCFISIDIVLIQLTDCSKTSYSGECFLGTTIYVWTDTKQIGYGQIKIFIKSAIVTNMARFWVTQICVLLWEN